MARDEFKNLGFDDDAKSDQKAGGSGEKAKEKGVKGELQW